MQQALNEFLDRIESIRKTLVLRDHLESFGGRSSSNLNEEEKKFQWYVRQLGLSGLQPSLDGSLLLLAAAFEQFVTNLIVAFATDLPNRVHSYSDLPNAIRSSNERFTGEALSDGRSRFQRSDLLRFVGNLSGCQAGTIPYVLNGEAMSLNNRNMNSSNLRELMQRLGIDNIWILLGKNRTLQRWSGPGGARAATSLAQNTLNNLIQDRNQIAHRVGMVTPGPSVIREYIGFQKALGRSLTKELVSYTNKL